MGFLAGLGLRDQGTRVQRHELRRIRIRSGFQLMPKPGMLPSLFMFVITPDQITDVLASRTVETGFQNTLLDEALKLAPKPNIDACCHDDLKVSRAL